MNNRLLVLNDLLDKAIEGKTKIVNKLNDTVGSSLTVNSTWDDIEKSIAYLLTGAGFATAVNGIGNAIIFLVRYRVVENDYGETLQLI